MDWGINIAFVLSIAVLVLESKSRTTRLTGGLRKAPKSGQRGIFVLVLECKREGMLAIIHNKALHRHGIAPFECECKSNQGGQTVLASLENSSQCNDPYEFQDSTGYS